jgi:hypothetical protein
MAANLVALVVSLSACFGVALALQLMLRRSATALLDEIVKVPAGTTFYLRVLCLCLLLSAAAGALGGSFDLKSDGRFMEYVWKVAAVLSGTLSTLSLILLVFLVLMTVLVAILRRRD